jgi:opacity protein-like surface antigen
MKAAFICLLAAVMIFPMAAVAGPIGVGVYGGGLIPVAQEDQGSGYLFGLKIRANLGGPFALEPNLNIGSYGEAEITGVGTREGASLKHYGLDVILGGGMASVGIKPYVFIGGAIYNTKRDGDNTANKSGWSTGAGLALGIMERIDFDLRGRISIASSETMGGSASKKSASVTFGVIYFFGENPGGNR